MSSDCTEQGPLAGVRPPELPHCQGIRYLGFQEALLGATVMNSKLLYPPLWQASSHATSSFRAGPQPAAAGCTVPACADCLPVFCRGHLAGKTCICIAGARPDWALTFSGSVFLFKRKPDARLQGGGRSIQPADATGARRSAGRAYLTCTPNLLSAERPSSFITLDLTGLLFFYFSLFFCPTGTSASHTFKLHCSCPLISSPETASLAENKPLVH